MMSQSKENTVLVLTVLITAALAGGGYWFFTNQEKLSLPSITSPSPTSSILSEIETTKANPTVLTMDGTTAMVTMIKQLRNAYAQVNPNMPTTFGVPDGKPNGTGKGFQNLIDDKVVIAASSRPLKKEEAEAQIQLIPVARDTMAVVIGIKNPFKGNLTMDQLRNIYTGKITNWSEVGGPNLPIKVINRNVGSGGRDFFQDAVLLGQQFAPDGPNFITWERSETTAILLSLGDNGIAYATTSQVANQEIVRIVPIDGVLPTDQSAVMSGKYPISRNLFLAVKKKTSPAVKQFIEFVLSSQGQEIVKRTGFMAIN